MFATSKEMAEIVTNQQNDLIFGRRKTLYKSTIAFHSSWINNYQCKENKCNAYHH
jgi:hypothetical protein